MKCTSCKLSFNNGVQCSTCKNHWDYECAQISQEQWQNLRSRNAIWKCGECRSSSESSPVCDSAEPSLRIVLEEIKDLKAQLSGLPCLIKDVRTIKDKLSSEFVKKMQELHGKMADLEGKVLDKNQLRLKVSSIQGEVAQIKGQISASVQRSHTNSINVKGVSTKKVEDLFSYPDIICKKRRTTKPTKIFYGMASNIFKHAFLIFRTYLDLFIDVIFGYWFDGMTGHVPMLDEDHRILMHSAVELANMIRTKKLKSEELVKICIERIAVVNPLINAVTDQRYEDAMKEAKQIDVMIEEGLPSDYFKSKPFLGVPFTAKESHAVAGLLHTLGLTSRRHVRASEDAECVRLLKEAGAIALAVTNVPEINKWQETRNLLFGQTNNPYRLGRTAGGSSGGEAALAACYATPIALCSDIGGSTRMPAFYCGLFAHNPTAGFTSLKGSLLRTGEEDTMASIGFVSRCLGDLAPLTAVVAGERAAGLRLERPVHLENVKYYYVETAQDLRVSPICKDLRDAMSKAITALSSSKPKKYYHRGFDYMYTLWRHAMTKEEGNFAELLTNNQGEANGIVELFRKLVGQSEYTGAAILKLLDDQVLPRVNPEWADNLIRELREDLLSTLGSDGVLLFPSAPMPAPRHYTAYLRPYNFAYWAILNVLRLPATQVPLGRLSKEMLPLGIQVVAGPQQDALCLAVAEHLEGFCGGFVPPCL